MANGALPERDRGGTVFAHPSEAEFVDLLTFYGIRWQYEPHTFILRETPDGRPDVGFSPDFYLPDHDLYVELTTRKPNLMDKKRRQVEALQARFPHIRIKLLTRSEYTVLARKLAARGPLQDPA